MKNSKAFDIQIIPHNNKKIKTYTVSRLKMGLIYLAVVIFLAGTVGIVFFYSFFAYLVVDYIEKAERVEYLEKKHGQIEELQREIFVLNEFKEKILTVFSSSEIASVDIGKLKESEKKEEGITKDLSKIPNIMPVDGWITVGFIPGRHLGIDISTREGTPFLATANGVVSEVGTNSVLGNYIILQHEFGFVTKYAHSSRVTVKEGERVTKGQVIGLVGRTGIVTGPHLHYEIIKDGKHIDPLKFINKSENS